MSRSLRLRLLLAAGLSIVTALLLIGTLLVWIFERQLRDRTLADLTHQMNQLAALVTPDPRVALKFDGDMADPRFDQPLGGLYWQIDRTGEPIARSRSLWDERLSIPASISATASLIDLEGPGHTALLAVAKDIEFRTGPDVSVPTRFRFVVAVDAQELVDSRKGLVRTLAAGLGTAFLGLLLAAWFQVEYGLRPFKAVRREVERIRVGATRTIVMDGFPNEVLPLAEDINKLAISQQEAIERARRRAGDLAHKLKTPLAALAAQADELRRSGQIAAAASLERSVETMRHHIERQLALARSQGGRSLLGATVQHVGDRINATIDVLRKLPQDRPIAWIVEGNTDARALMGTEDFDEVIGNVLDNARKWARSRVVISIEGRGSDLEIRIGDDGPGIPEDDLAKVLERGVRLDECVQGSGLGLSIVQAILESYGSGLLLTRAALGGLQASFIVTGTYDAAATRTDRSSYRG
jgi:signal transduction histidine kinase